MAKICIIDDEKSICESLKWILEKKGYKVKYATNFENALELIKKENFDLYFIDLVLPGGEGIDLIRKMKNYKRDGKIIVITGYPSTPTLVESVRLHVFDYVSKPIDPANVLKIVELALNFKDEEDKEE